MNSDELRQAIEGPALKQALYFEPPELVGKLIDEVGQMPGALPLLSFTLSELYIKLRDRWVKDNASDRALRIKDYEEIGGVAGALTRRATEEYDNLVSDFGEASGKAYQATMRRVMLRMVTIEGGGSARRRISESELVYPNSEENKRVAQVSNRLLNARLLVKGQEGGEPYVEPAHDFLVRGWDNLQTWRTQEQENLILQQLLAPASKDWLNSQKAIGALWDDNPRIVLLKQVFESDNNWLNQLETEFIQRSLQRRQNNRRRLISSIVGVLLTLSGLTTFALVQQGLAQKNAQDAKDQAQLALSNQKEAESQRNQAEEQRKVAENRLKRLCQALEGQANIAKRTNDPSVYSADADLYALKEECRAFKGTSVI